MPKNLVIKPLDGLDNRMRSVEIGIRVRRTDKLNSINSVVLKSLSNACMRKLAGIRILYFFLPLIPILMNQH
jgi:hypothetical protein